MVSNNIHYLLSILNSKISFFYLKSLAPIISDSAISLKLIFLEKLPIPRISEDKQKPFIERVDKILEITKQNFYDPKNPSKEQLELEKEIDEMVYELYGLSEEEIKVVEESFK